ILFVGTIESYKGVGLLLEAFKQISRQYNDINLKIVGEGAGKEGYQNWVEKNGLQYRVTFVGRVPWDHMGRIYDEAAIVVAPHIWVEPFGRTVAEAMARGKIVISANIGGPAEIIQPFKTGVLFERGSVEDLILSIGEVLEMNEFDKREISRAAREWVANNLNIEKIAREYEEVYKNYLC
ncbi:MAG: glycosyltransferase, partial [Candidatus Andersenbacteria bacterium]|nr:glycosyltransferase [Candidatus Andersenbacteria bacterium]